MTLVFATAVMITVLMFTTIGLVEPAPFGTRWSCSPPRVGIAHAQDQWRSIFFRDQRGSSAAFNDGIWAVGMVSVASVRLGLPNNWSVAAVWGGGATNAALVGWVQVRLLPTVFADTKDWSLTRDLRRLRILVGGGGR